MHAIVNETLWAIREDKHAELMTRLEVSRATSPEYIITYGTDTGTSNTDVPFAARPEEPKLYTTTGEGGSIAVIPVKGVLLPRHDQYLAWWGFENSGYAEIQQAVAAANADPKVTAILLDVDSPGGVAIGTLETGNAIKASSKPVYAYVSGEACSAAYWLTSQAKSITAGPQSIVGSIGVFVVMRDTSEKARAEGVKVHVVRSGAVKGAGTWGAEISEAQLAVAQGLVDGLAAQFKEAVGAGRHLEPDVVNAIATGAYWIAATAKQFALIDSLNSYAAAVGAIAEEHQPERRTFTMSENKQEEQPTAEQTLHDAVALAAARLQELESAFPDDPAFARAQWQDGSDARAARENHYPIVVKQLAEATTEVTRLRAEVDALKAKAATRGAPAPHTAAHGAAQGVPFNPSAEAEVSRESLEAEARETAKATGKKFHETYVALLKKHGLYGQEV